jgi:putative resolvase
MRTPTSWHRAGKAALKLGVSTSTLRGWAKNEKISFRTTAGGQRRFDVTSVQCHKPANQISNLSPVSSNCETGTATGDTKQKTPATRGGAIYCRVSSAKQKDDLQRQIDQLRETYASHTIFTDICSGLKYKRKGLSRLLERVQAGEFSEVVVAHKDRLARFGTELIEWVLNQAGTSLVILDRNQLSHSEELTQDLMAIVHVFSCRLNGKRRYKSKHEAENGTPCGVQGSHGPNSESDHEGRI